MAKLCSPYGSSPISSFFNELTANALSDEFLHIQPDPFDFFGDLPSICGDIQKIESDTFSPYGTDIDLDIKPEVRNTDLMWCTAPSEILSTSASSMSSDISSGVPLAIVMGVPNPTNSSNSSNTSQTPSSHIKIEKEEIIQPTVVTAKKLNPASFKQEDTNCSSSSSSIQVKQEPTDDVEQQLAHHSIPNSKTQTSINNTTTSQPHPVMIHTTVMTPTSMQNIPPGTSLLRKSQQQKKSQQQTRPSSLNITKRGDQLLPNTNAACSDFNTSSSSSSLNSSLLYQRPDTPHSLDDDNSPTEFKHTVDLRACVMGSNNIPLTTDQVFIRNVEQELQDTSKNQIDTRLISTCSLAEVLDVINNSPTNSSDYLNHKSTSNGIATTPNTTTSSNSSGVFSYHSNLMRSSESDSDEESTRGSCTSSLSDNELTFGAGGVSPVSSQSSNIISTQHYMQHRDHSYTRCKDGMDDLSTNLETPSDSGELVKSNFFFIYLLYFGK